MFGDIKDLVDMMKKSDVHLTSLLKEMRSTNHHLDQIVALMKEQTALLKGSKKERRKE